MSVIFILIGCSLLLACSFLIAFLWASKGGQFEDDYTPSVRMLFDGSTTRSAAQNQAKPKAPATKQPKKNSSIKPSANVRK